MSYRGAPSYGCQICRQRKKKCDNAQPTCQNCAKSGWKCPGYRDMLELLFRNESAKVVERARAKQPGPRAPQVERLGHGRGKTIKERIASLGSPETAKSATANYRMDLPQSAPEMTGPEAVLPFDLDQLAIGYFFHYYVIGDDAVSGGWKEADADRCLSASILALGAAGVTKSGPGSSCSPCAQARYLEAIRLTNKALRTPSDVKKDSVLLAINLLGIFENMTGLQRTLEAWRNHIEGAAALLQHRGSEQFETAEGGRLFVRTSMCLVTSCIGRRLPIPAHIHRLASKAENQVPLEKEKLWLVLRLDLRFADLYAKFLPDNVLPPTENAQSTLQEALALDREMSRFLNDFSDDWYFDRIRARGPTIFAGDMHVYPHFAVVSQYNSIRWKRIIIHDMILKLLYTHGDPNSLHFSDPHTSYIRDATRNIHQLQLDILATVPQYFNGSFPELSFLSPLSKTSPEGVPRDRMWTNFAIKDSNPWRSMKRQSPSLPLVRLSCTYTIQWALYIAGAADFADGEVRSWVIKILRLLGRAMGLQQAMMLARSLELYEGEQLDEHLKIAAREAEYRSSGAPGGESSS